ncbi:hypothetical protein HMI55_005355 [Coelomomyces lativittatus]|nr:hypothetical protein HMI55_005355 [Coelomomyces lativittatus]
MVVSLPIYEPEEEENHPFSKPNPTTTQTTPGSDSTHVLSKWGLHLEHQVETTLETWIRQSRQTTLNSYFRVKNHTTAWMNQVLQVEKKISDSIHALHDPKELWLPNLFYVTTATFTGSLLTRNKPFWTRWFVPPFCFVTSTMYFFPSTFHRTMTHLPIPSSFISFLHSHTTPNDVFQTIQSTYQTWISKFK